MADKIQDFIKEYGEDLEKENTSLYFIIEAFSLYRKGEFVECDNFIEKNVKGTQGINKNESQAPFTKETFSPSGLKPKKIHNAQRFGEVCSAVANYYDAGKKIPIEWIEEYNELITDLNRS